MSAREAWLVLPSSEQTTCTLSILSMNHAWGLSTVPCTFLIIGICRCITTGDPDTDSEEPPLSSALSGWLVLGVASRLGHRRSCQRTRPVGSPRSSALLNRQHLSCSTAGRSPTHPRTAPGVSQQSSGCSSLSLHKRFISPNNTCGICSACSTGTSTFFTVLLL